MDDAPGLVLVFAGMVLLRLQHSPDSPKFEAPYKFFSLPHLGPPYQETFVCQIMRDEEEDDLEPGPEATSMKQRLTRYIFPEEMKLPLYKPKGSVTAAVDTSSTFM